VRLGRVSSASRHSSSCGTEAERPQVNLRQLSVLRRLNRAATTVEQTEPARQQIRAGSGTYGRREAVPTWRVQLAVRTKSTLRLMGAMCVLPGSIGRSSV
jgi:hypothetical protein